MGSFDPSIQDLQTAWLALLKDRGRCAGNGFRFGNSGFVSVPPGLGTFANSALGVVDDFAGDVRRPARFRFYRGREELQVDDLHAFRLVTLQQAERLVYQQQPFIVRSFRDLDVTEIVAFGTLVVALVGVFHPSTIHQSAARSLCRRL